MQAWRRAGGGEVLVSESVRLALDPATPLGDRREVVAKGKEAPIEVYQRCDTIDIRHSVWKPQRSPPRRCHCKEDRQNVSRREALGKKHINPHNRPMRQIGNRTRSQPGLNPSEHSLRLAGVHQSTGQALAALATTGVPKGIYQIGRAHV